MESFNGRFRDECLNENWFADLHHAHSASPTDRRLYRAGGLVGFGLENAEAQRGKAHAVVSAMEGTSILVVMTSPLIYVEV